MSKHFDFNTKPIKSDSHYFKEYINTKTINNEDTYPMYE